MTKVLESLVFGVPVSVVKLSGYVAALLVVSGIVIPQIPKVISIRKSHSA